MDERLPIRCLAEELNGQLQGSVGMVGCVDGATFPTSHSSPLAAYPTATVCSCIRCSSWLEASIIALGVWQDMGINPL